MARTYGKAQDLIDFTRASSGTALRRVKYGAELVTNGAFDTDSDWTKGTGWSISGGVAVSSGSNNYAGLQQIASLTVGKVYSVTFTISSYTSGSLKFAIGSTTGNVYASVGTFTENFVYIEPHASGKNVSIFPWGAFVGTIDNVSVKEVTFDTSDGDLVLFNHPNNIPRIEYDANGNLLGLLVEEARTNLITYSEDFANAAWSGYWQKPTFVTGQLAPDGTYTAMKWNASTTTGSGSGASGGLVFGQGQAISGDTYTASVWLKASSAIDMSFGLTDGATGIITLTTEWVRYTYTGVAVNALRLFQLNENTNLDIDIYIWGAQTEHASFPTSYIPTSGSTATRSADVASLSTSAFGYRQDEGTVVLEAQHFTTESTNAHGGFGLDDGTTNNRIYYYQNKGQYIGSVSGSTVFNIDATDPPENTPTKVATVYKENDYAFYLNGSSIGTDTSAGVPVVDTLKIGNTTVTSSQLNGHIKSLKYYPRRLTNDQLVEVTS